MPVTTRLQATDCETVVCVSSGPPGLKGPVYKVHEAGCGEPQLVSARCVEPKLWDINDVESVGLKNPEGESVGVKFPCARVEDIMARAVEYFLVMWVGR